MKKILFFIKVPPPITGATLMNKRVNDSKIIRDGLFIRSIKISYAESVKDLGTLSKKKFLILPLVVFKLVYELLFHRPNIVYFQISPFGFAFLRDSFFVLIIKIFRVKIIFHLRGKGIKNVVKNSKLKKILYSFVFNNTEIICLSELLIDDIKEVYKRKPFIVYNAIPIETYYPPPKKLSETVNVLFLSNLLIEKGILGYLDSLGILDKKGFDFNGVIVGAEADLNKSDLDILLKRKKISHKIQYIGSKYDDEKLKQLYNADIFVFPTTNETWGGVILEAMQFELPVIATYEGSIPIIVDDGVTGFLVEKQNPQALADKIEILIKDKELREKMGKAGRKKFLEKYTLDIFEKNMKNVFEEVLNKAL